MSKVACPVRKGALRTPKAPALITTDRSFTFSELDSYVEAAARRFEQEGFGPGDVIALSGAPNTEYVVALLGMLRLGAIACPVNPKFPEEYARKLLERVGAKTVALAEETSATLALPACAEGNRPPWMEGCGESSSPDAMSLNLDERRPATIIFTSGSTGDPKAAMHSIGNHIHSARLSNQNIRVEPGDRWLLSLPLYHVAGIGVVFRCLMGGAAMAIPAPGAPLAEAVRESGATHVSLVATQLHRLLQSAEGRAALRTMKAILLGGSGIPESLVREAYGLGLRIHTSYGMTEMSSQVTTTRPCDPIERLLTSGAPLDPDMLRIAEDREIQVCGKTLFLGYLDGGQLRRPLTSDGWFATGDLGELDDGGYLRVTGRKDNMFIAGGENIQPEEIEATLCRCPGVLEAIVVPVSHPEFGAVPVAFVRCASGVPVEDALRAALGSRLPNFKIPRRVYSWPEEIAPAGIKPDRRALAAHAQNMVRVSCA